LILPSKRSLRIPLALAVAGRLSRPGWDAGRAAGALGLTPGSVGGSPASSTPIAKVAAGPYPNGNRLAGGQLGTADRCPIPDGGPSRRPDRPGCTPTSAP